MILKVSDNRIFDHKQGLVRAFFKPTIDPRGVQGFRLDRQDRMPNGIRAHVVYMDKDDGGYRNELREDNTLWVQTAISEVARSRANNQPLDNKQDTAMFAQYGDNVRFMGVFRYAEWKGESLFRKRVSDEIEMPEPPKDGLYSFTAAEIDEELVAELNGKAKLYDAYMGDTPLVCHPSDDGQRLLRYCDQWNMVQAGLATYLGKKYGTTTDIFSNTFQTTDQSRKRMQIGGEDIEIATNIHIKTLLLTRIKIIFDAYQNEDTRQLRFNVRFINDKKETYDTIQKLLASGKIHRCANPQHADIQHADIQHAGQSSASDLSFPRNRIIFGSPGTGKSWQINEDIKAFGNNVTRVTFHPEYSYFDFVGSYRPVEEKGEITYKFCPGPFAKILRNALRHEQDYCLVIEEINRARVAAVFGDLFQLLDRKDGESEYPVYPSAELSKYLTEKADEDDAETVELADEGLRLPPNLYIWATMNSADQGVFPMDTAFKRRWSFEYRDLDEGADRGRWDEIRRGINKLLLDFNVNEDKLMGFFFLKEEERGEKLEAALKDKVLMYLYEDAAKAFRKSLFKQELKTYSQLKENLNVEAADIGIFAKPLSM